MEEQLLKSTPYFTIGSASTNKTLLQLGKETLSEEDVKQMKAATTSSNLFK